MEKIESSFDMMNRTLEKKKLLPINDHITNDFTEMLHKRLEQLESHNSKLENDLKCLEDRVKNKCFILCKKIKWKIFIITCFSV